MPSLESIRAHMFDHTAAPTSNNQVPTRKTRLRKMEFPDPLILLTTINTTRALVNGIKNKYILLTRLTSVTTNIHNTEASTFKVHRGLAFLETVMTIPEATSNEAISCPPRL